MSDPSLNQVFEKAREEFLASLSDSERTLFRKCPSADQLIAEVRKLGHGAKDRSWGRRIVASVKAFSDALQPYFEAIGILVQSELATIAWGAIRLVFQLASNYISFFEKLAKALDRITEVLPQYDQLSTLCAAKPSPRLQSSLCKVYVDLLRFCQSVARVFTRKDGKAKRSPFVVTGLIWKPFDSSFEDLLDDFKFHADLVKSELLLAELFETQTGKEVIAGQIREINVRLAKAEKARAARETTEGRRALEETHKENMLYRFDRIHRWILPPQFAQEFERALDQREPETAEWLFEEDLFNGWLEFREIGDPNRGVGSFGKRAIWVQGNPGYGKTILAASTVKELKGLRGPQGTKLQVFYFFFRSGIPELQDPLSPLRSFLAQLFYSSKEDKDIIDKFAFIMDEKSSGQLIATRNDLIELLQLCTESFGDIFFVLDGIDECDDSGVVVKDLLALACDSNVKVIIFSRPNVAALFRATPQEQQLNIGRRNCKDMESYITTKVGGLADEGLLPSSVDTSLLIERLMIGADGMFLWARLMLSFLNSPALTRRQRLDTIMNVYLPEGLESMYDRIANLICQGNQVEQGLARQILSWLLYSKRPMTVHELQEAVSPMNADTNPDEGDFPNFARVVIMCCAGLVEVQKMFSATFDSEISSFQFIHLSVTEYLSSQESHDSGQRKVFQSSTGQMLISRPHSLIEITNQCLLALSYKLPSQPLSGSLDTDATPSQLHRAFPLCSYAVFYWIGHLHDTMSYGCFTNANFPGMLRTLSQFLTLKRVLMAYIEASYVFRITPPRDIFQQWTKGVISDRSQLGLDDSTLNKTVDDCLELCRYLEVLDREWGSQLLKSPKCIWEEVVAFTPSRLLAQTTSTQVRTLIMDGPKNELISSRCLSKISEVSEDGRMVAVLSIWPSKAYETHAQWSMRPVASMIYRLCTNWLARYEIWTVADDPVCSTDVCIPLDSNEIHLQMQRSLWQEDPSWSCGTLKLQFPLAISSNICLISILRTVYLFTVTANHEARMHALSLPLDFEPHLEAIWPAVRNMQDPPEKPTGEQQERGEGAGLRSSLRDFLRPGTTSRQHARSVSHERYELLDPGTTGKKRSHIWSRLSGRPRTPDHAFTFTGSHLYRYWISFCRQGSFLLFLDHPPRQTRFEDAPSTIALFKVESKESLIISLVARTKQIICSEYVQLPAPKVVLHPREPVVAFYFPRVEQEQEASVRLWAYLQARIPPLAVGISECGGIDDVHFSNCGDYVVIKTSGSSVPSVVRIDSVLLTGSSPSVGNDATSGDTFDNTTITMTSNTGPMMQMPGGSSRAVLRGGTSVADDNTSTSVSVVHTSSEISIHKWKCEGEGSERETKEEIIQLTKLPAWSRLSASSVAISMPESGDDAVRLVLNKTARQWEDMTQEVDTQLPAVVSRSVRTLKYSSSDNRSLEMREQPQL